MHTQTIRPPFPPEPATPETEAFLKAAKPITKLALAIAEIERSTKAWGGDHLLGCALDVQEVEEFTPEQLEWLHELQAKAASLLGTIDKTQSALRQITKATLAIPEAFGSPEVAA